MEDGESRVKILNRRDRSSILNPPTSIPATIPVLIFEAAEKESDFAGLSDCIESKSAIPISQS